MTLTLLHKDGKWVFPLVTYYQHGLGTPLCLALLAYVEDSNEFESETIITVNLPGAERSAGCQFIDTNNNGEEVLDWLMLYGLCTPTGRYAVSGFCKYPEVDFIRANASCSRKSFATGILTSLIDGQEKAVIRDCLHGLACQCPFIWIPFRYFLPFLSGFPHPKLRYDVCAAVRPPLQGTEGCARSTAVCFIPLHAGASTCRNNRYSAIWASCLVVAPAHSAFCP